MATPIKSLFPPIEKKPFLLNKQKNGSRRPTSCIDKNDGRTREKDVRERRRRIYTFRTCWEKGQRREAKNSVIFFHTHSVPIIREFKDKNAIASMALITWFCQLASCYKMKMHKTQSSSLVFKFQALLQLPSFKFAPASILFVTSSFPFKCSFLYNSLCC